MSKFIRTKEEIIYVGDLIKDEYGNYCNPKDYETIEVRAEYIIKEADTIEELCDEFVVVAVKGGKPYTIDTFQRDELLKDRQKIFSYGFEAVYGAIWTDEGLIYVAKMNDKGELVLI